MKTVKLSKEETHLLASLAVVHNLTVKSPWVSALVEKLMAPEVLLLKDGVTCTCGGCPTVFEGLSEDGRAWYYRLRHGAWRVCWDTGDFNVIASGNSAEDGVISFDEMVREVEAASSVRFV